MAVETKTVNANVADTQTTDVLIVGAGPTGLMLALELAVQNVSFRIIDKLPVASDKSKALVVQPRTLEALNRHGLAQEFVDTGRFQNRMQISVNKKLAGYVNLQEMGQEDTEYRRPLFMSQADTEHFIDTALQRYGFAVERPLTVESIQQDDQGVTVSISHADGSKETLNCKYVVGCDGAHSIVRQAGKINFPGEPYPQEFILCDVTIKWDQPADSVNIFLGDGVLLFFPLKNDVVRLVASRPASETEAPDPTLAEFQDMFSKLAPGNGQLNTPTWLTRFRHHKRCADRFRSGRLFIAGDAAHIHSPAGGQGMNTGIQDAVNLGWKLGRVLRGEKDDSLLETYNTERHRVGLNLLKGTDNLFKSISKSNPIFLYLRNLLASWIIPWQMGSLERSQKRFRFATQLKIRYRRSPIVGTSRTYKGPLFGGDRAPDGPLKASDGEIFTLHGVLDGQSHHLLLFSGTRNNAVGENSLSSATDEFLRGNSTWVKRYCILSSTQAKSAYTDSDGVLHKRYGFEVPGYVLIRPDGYLAYIGKLEAFAELVSFAEK